MKENKLTIEDAMKYPKADVVKSDNGMIWHGIYYWIWDSATGVLDISDCKLILRSIESLKDEEKKIIYIKFFYKGTRFFGNDWHGWDRLSTIDHHVDTRKLLRLYDYLRSILVDIDGLEKQGVAVYESEGK